MKTLKFTGREVYTDHIHNASISNREASGQCVWIHVEDGIITDSRLLTTSSYMDGDGWHQLSNGAGCCAPTSLAGIAEAISRHI